MTTYVLFGIPFKILDLLQVLWTSRELLGEKYVWSIYVEI